MVFFHGGGLTSGTGSSTTYNHPKLPSQGVVTVTVNSRLGPIGYLAHPELTAEGLGSGNQGTMDLAASLKWVKDNIAAFGGDPTRVTIFGESGGGMKVITQMSTPSTKGLFHRAIVESGASLASTPLADAEARGKALQTALGAASLADMRKKTWQEVLAAGQQSQFRASPAVDGKVIPTPIREQFEKGQQHQVPLIVGANAGEAMLRSSVPAMADLHSASGAPTWTYNFTHLPLGWREEKGCVAFHGLELTYVFGAVPEGLKSPTTQGLARGGGCSSSLPRHDDIDMKVADEASKIWAQFAKTGNPSVPGLVDWPQWSKTSNVYLDIGAPMKAKSNIQASYTPPPSGN
jgi:para-nitrobenzyl esterase